MDEIVGKIKITENLLSQIKACELQIDRAIRLFIDENDYVCAITLACAAEGVLGEWLTDKGDENVTYALKGAVKDKFLPETTMKEINDAHVNRARNFLKHASQSLMNEEGFDLELESITAITRAIGNYGMVMDDITKGSIEFLKWLKSNRRDLLDASNELTL